MSLDLWPADLAPPRSPMPASIRLTRFYRHVFLWVLQGWLAMFYIGAAAAKLTQPRETLAHLLAWPATVDPALIQAVGWTELALSMAVLAPVVSWRLFRAVLRIGAAALLAEALVMGAYHALGRDWSLTAVNLMLAAMAATVLLGRAPAAERMDART